MVLIKLNQHDHQPNIHLIKGNIFKNYDPKKSSRISYAKKSSNILMQKKF